MASITALLHTNNDALRLGRCLETLYACDHILIVDHGSQDDTVRIAREHGARVIAAVPNASPDHYAQSADPGWILALDPCESLTEGLAASLFDLHEGWKFAGNITAPAYSMFVREETADGWIEIPAAETRLVPHTWNRWSGRLPLRAPSALALDGELLRFTFP
jgi:hypothetical protein